MRGYVAAGVVVAMTVLAGCTDEPEPRFDDPTETPSASPSTPAAEEPEPWEEKSKAGAVAFAKYWIVVFNEAAAGGGTDELKALSAPDCGTCDSVIERLDSIYDSGGFFEGDGYTVVYATAGKVGVDDRVTVALRVSRASEKIQESSDAPIQKNPASKASYSAQLVWESESWNMGELVVFN